MTSLMAKLSITAKISIITMATIIPPFFWLLIRFIAFPGPVDLLQFFVVLLVSAGLSVAAATIVIKSYRFSFQGLVKMMDNAVSGDLTEHITINDNDEIAEIGRKLSLLLEKFRKTMRHFAQSSQVVTGVAFNLEQAAKDMTSGVEQVSLQVSSVATASEEMASTSAEIAKNCDSAAKGSEKANDSAVTGESIIRESVDMMTRISDIVSESASIIEGLGSRSDQIGQIINLIDEIADQTNLLALNAAIEAARAGEHGRGFAVVADEVRKLAERTSSATKEIGDTIKAMQHEAKQAVIATEKGVKEVKAGTDAAAQLGEAFKNTLTRINQVSSEIAQIAVASNQQTATVDEIANNINRVSGVMSQTSANAGKNSKTASELTALFTELNEVVGQYKIATPEDAETLAKEAAAWVKGIGRERGLAEICNLRGRFCRDGIYVTAHDINGWFLASPLNPQLIGQNHADFQGPDGKYFNRESMELAKKGGGWVEYLWTNPATRKLQQKKSRVERIEGTDMYILCGVFI